MAVAATVIVSLYAVWVDKELAKVHPGPVNLPSVSQPSMDVEARHVQRLTSDPHVFFVSEAPTLSMSTAMPQQQNMNRAQSDNHLHTTCTTPFVIMLKNTTTVNLICLVFLFTNPLTVILGIIYSNCEFSDQCERYIFLYECIAPFRFLCMNISLILIVRRLKNN